MVRSSTMVLVFTKVKVVKFYTDESKQWTILKICKLKGNGNGAQGLVEIDIDRTSWTIGV